MWQGPQAFLITSLHPNKFQVSSTLSPPLSQSHPKFKNVAEQDPLLYSRALQMGEEKKAQRMKLGEAVSKGIIANETLAYFIGRTYLFCTSVGVTPAGRGLCVTRVGVLHVMKKVREGRLWG